MGYEVQSGRVLRLPGELTIHAAEEFVNILGEQLAEIPEIVIDGAYLMQIDACGLQLLVAGAKESKIRGKPFAIVNPSDYLERILAITGAGKVISLRKEG